MSLSDQGKLKGNPGEVVAVVGDKVGNVDIFRPRWVLRNAEKTGW